MRKHILKAGKHGVCAGLKRTPVMTLREAAAEENFKAFCDELDCTGYECVASSQTSFGDIFRGEVKVEPYDGRYGKGFKITEYADWKYGMAPAYEIEYWIGNERG